MPRIARSLASDVVALLLGFAIVSLSPKVIAASRVAVPMRSSSMAPSVWLLSPSDGQSVNGNVTVSATASQDTQVIQFQLNGGSLGPAITSGACSLSWNTNAVNDGTYTLDVVGYDAIGNATTSSPATVTVENSAPQISNVAVSAITSSSATVSWTTNQAASSGIDYGPTASYTNSTPLDVTMVMQHAQMIVGLASSTIYHFRVVSWNGVGVLATSGDFTFTTSGAGSSPSGGDNGSPAPTPTPTPTTPGGCAVADPFAALGGGTCINGGWYPPGMGTGGASPSPTPTPTPTSTPTPTPGAPAPATCSTPDPFTAIGGGTCVNGGWVPRAVASPPPAPTPTPGSSPTPTPAPPSSSNPGGCTTSDPFVTLGGGTCLNGGWFPPGMLPAPGNVSAAPPAQNTPGGCQTPNPFVSLQGYHGVCANGGWYPVRNGG